MKTISRPMTTNINRSRAVSSSCRLSFIIPPIQMISRKKTSTPTRERATEINFLSMGCSSISIHMGQRLSPQETTGARQVLQVHFQERSRHDAVGARAPSIGPHFLGRSIADQPPLVEP